MNHCLTNNLSQTDFPQTMCHFFFFTELTKVNCLIILSSFGRWCSNKKSVLLFSNHQILNNFVLSLCNILIFCLYIVLCLLYSNIVTQLKTYCKPSKPWNWSLNKKVIKREQNSRKTYKPELRNMVVINTLLMIDSRVDSHHI